MVNDYVITIDIDWAPDWIISEVADILIKNKLKSTWFVTHETPEIKKMLEYPDLFELGLHPNFSEGSSQGKNPKKVMSYLKKLLPNATSVRTHGAIQSSNLLQLMNEDFNIQCDVSIYLPETPSIIPHEIFFSKNEKSLLRLPYFWEDMDEMNRPEPCFSFSNEKFHVDGIKIFAFHPINIVLNCFEMADYITCKTNVKINACTYADLEDYVNKNKEGSGTFFKELVEFIKNNQQNPGITISELATKWEQKTGDWK